MTSQSGGGGGIPGVTPDGQTPPGITIAGALVAGDPNATDVASLSFINGFLEVEDVPGSSVDGDTVLVVRQSQPLVSDLGAFALNVSRSGALNGHDYQVATCIIGDTTDATAPVLEVYKGSTVILELGVQPNITGALSSVTDANVKAILTSIIAALVGIKVAVDGTT